MLLLYIKTVILVAPFGFCKGWDVSHHSSKTDTCRRAVKYCTAKLETGRISENNAHIGYTVEKDTQGSDMEITEKDLSLVREWFEELQEANPSCLEPDDYALAQKIYEFLGKRLPKYVLQ